MRRDQYIIDRGFKELSQQTINGNIKRRLLSVYAQEINNNTDIHCSAVPDDILSHTATLKIQGTVSITYIE